MEYYFADGENQKGPFPLAELKRQGVRADTLVWREGMSQWQRADAVPDVWAAVTAGGGASAGGSQAGGSQAGGSQAAQGPGVIPLAPDHTTAAQPSGYGQPAYAQPSYNPSPYGAPLTYGGYGSTQQTNGMAIASLILGILSIPMMCGYGVGVPCAILAVILGHLARGKIRRGEGSGDGMALGGLICGYIALALFVIGLLLFLIFVVFAAAAGSSGSGGY